MIWTTKEKFNFIFYSNSLNEAMCYELCFKINKNGNKSKHGKLCPKQIPLCNHSHNWNIDINNPIQNLYKFHCEIMGPSIKFIISCT
jgi:hypothetical protein